MPILHWDKAYDVGVALFDIEHRQVFHLTNALYDAILDGAPGEALSEACTKLFDTVTRHFGHEEDAFVSSDYPDAARHRQHHDAFRAKVEEFRTLMPQVHGTLLALEVSKLLKFWIFEHIQKEDAALCRHLRSKGIA
jgi:hemerythrin